jgi:hypothetical protein
VLAKPTRLEVISLANVGFRRFFCESNFTLRKRLFKSLVVLSALLVRSRLIINGFDLRSIDTCLEGEFCSLLVSICTMLVYKFTCKRFYFVINLRKKTLCFDFSLSAKMERFKFSNYYEEETKPQKKK